MGELRITTLEGVRASLTSDSFDAFRSSLRGPSLRPGDADYDEARLIWNGMMDRRGRVTAAVTAFGSRNMNYMFEFDSVWRDPADADKNISWTGEKWADLQPYSMGGLYINFPGFGEGGENLVRSAVGNKSYERLAKFKAKFDPSNLFRLNQNIGPSEYSIGKHQALTLADGV